MKVLSHLRVVELSSDPEVRVAGRLLAQLGAQVECLVTRELSEAFMPLKALDFEKTIKKAEVIKYFREEIQNAHVVLASREVLARVSLLMPEVLTFEKIIVDSTGKYEQESSAATLSAQEISEQAGLFEQPFKVSGTMPHDIPIVEFLGGIFIAQSALLGIISQKTTGHGENISVSLFDTALFAKGLQALLVNGIVANWQPFRWMASPFQALWETSDKRFVFLHLGISRHLQKFIDLLERSGFKKYAEKLEKTLSSETLRDPVSPKNVFEVYKARRILGSLFRERDAFFWEKLLCDAGLCCIIARSYGEWQRHVHAKTSRLVVFAEDELGKRSGIPGELVKIALSASKSSESPLGEQREEHLRKCLRGLRVLDFTQVIAGPMVGRTLADFGAEVIRIENPFANEAFFEPFHTAYHAFKQSKKIDLQTKQGKQELFTFIKEWQPQVVVQNFSKGVAQKLGIDNEALQKLCGHFIFVDLTAFGHGGMLENLPGFEQTAQALCGICFDYGKNTPKSLPIPVNDMGCGLLGALGTLAVLAGQGANVSAQVHTSLAASATLISALSPERMTAHARNLGENSNRNSRKSSRKNRAPHRQSYRKTLKEYLKARHPLVTEAPTPAGQMVPVLRVPIYSREVQLNQIPVVPNTNTSPKPTMAVTLKWFLRELPWIVYRIWN